MEQTWQSTSFGPWNAFYEEKIEINYMKIPI